MLQILHRLTHRFSHQFQLKLLLSLISFILFSFIYFPITLSSQNLLPDGGFEILIDQDCQSPTLEFEKLQYWYLLDATPDLFVGGCSFDETDFVFWDESINPYEGDNYAGIWSRWNSNNTYFTEGIASSLEQPLVAGTTYYFEMAIRNQGGFEGLVGSGSMPGCSLEPEKHIDLYLSQDSIRVINDFSNGTASTTASLVATLDSEFIQGGESEEWTLVSTCFEARGGEDFFAIIMPLGTFGDLPLCAQNMATSGVFRSFYYHIDGALITELPLSLEAEISACQDRDFEVDLLELFDFSLLESAVLNWGDGFSGASRRLSSIEDYQISADLGCGSIPIVLNILPENCEVDLYIPNVFSPNADGQNDTFIISMTNATEVKNFQLTVFNRWGGIIYQGQNIDLAWDGKADGQYVNAGVYSWSLSFDIETLEGVSRTTKNGQVLIVR